MKNNCNDINGFLEGDSTIHDAIKAPHLDDKITSFLETYQKDIDNSKNKPIPEFNPLAKIKQYKGEKRLKLIRNSSIAASIAGVLILIAFPFLKLDKTQSRYAQLTPEEVHQINKNTAKALFYFSTEMNKSLKQIEQVQMTNKSIQEMKILNETNIEDIIPIK